MSDNPDGFVVIHHPKDGGEKYGVGPFPPIEDLAAMLLASPPCDCVCEVLWVGFPPHVKLAIAVPQSILDLVESEDDGDGDPLLPERVH